MSWCFEGPSTTFRRRCDARWATSGGASGAKSLRLRCQISCSSVSYYRRRQERSSCPSRVLPPRRNGSIHRRPWRSIRRRATIDSNRIQKRRELFRISRYITSWPSRAPNTRLENIPFCQIVLVIQQPSLLASLPKLWPQSHATGTASLGYLSPHQRRWQRVGIH